MLFRGISSCSLLDDNRKIPALFIHSLSISPLLQRKRNFSRSFAKRNTEGVIFTRSSDSRRNKGGGLDPPEKIRDMRLKKVGEVLMTRISIVLVPRTSSLLQYLLRKMTVTLRKAPKHYQICTISENKIEIK